MQWGSAKDFTDCVSFMNLIRFDLENKLELQELLELFSYQRLQSQVVLLSSEKQLFRLHKAVLEIKSVMPYKVGMDDRTAAFLHAFTW